MRKSRYSDEQIAAALRQAEIGTPIADITRKLGISEATFYVWKKALRNVSARLRSASCVSSARKTPNSKRSSLT